MKTSGITAALPAQDLRRAKAFYIENVGLQAVESRFLEATDGRVGLTVGDGVNQLFVFPAQARSSAEFTQAVIQVPDVRVAVEEMRGRGVEFEEYDTPETRTENGIARTPDGGEGVVVQGLGRQPDRRRSRPAGLGVEHGLRRRLLRADDFEVLIEEDVVRPVDPDVVDVVLAVAQLHDAVDDAPRVSGQRSFGRLIRGCSADDRA